ncbi:MAG: hypothetical protein HKO98_15990, partial [Gemmatimonadetes bacterium]|nr:hypothetical protein [Gemmatimonadota bacterium]
MSEALSPEATEVADFLLSEESYITFGLGKLNFTLAGFRVDTQGYREIGHKIRQGAIEVRPVESAPGSSVAAVYTGLLDRLSVPAGLDLHTPRRRRIKDQSMVVHEVTHALVDFHRFTTTGALDEACAYVAGQLYAMSLGDLQSSSRPRDNAIFTASRTIVQQRRMKFVPGAVLMASDSDVAALAAAVRGHTQAYPDADVRRTGDGVHGGLIDP